MGNKQFQKRNVYVVPSIFNHKLFIFYGFYSTEEKKHNKKGIKHVIIIHYKHKVWLSDEIAALKANIS